jgi:hypothetical protein
MVSLFNAIILYHIFIDLSKLFHLKI